MTVAERTDANVEPKSNFKPFLATSSPCLELSALTEPVIIPMELKFAKLTRNTDIIPTAFVDKPAEMSVKLNIATNSLVTSLVAMMLPACTLSAQGIPITKAIGAKIYPKMVWKETLNSISKR